MRSRLRPIASRFPSSFVVFYGGGSVVYKVVKEFVSGSNSFAIDQEIDTAKEEHSKGYKAGFFASLAVQGFLEEVPAQA
jgi:hypothetical protein